MKKSIILLFIYCLTIYYLFGFELKVIKEYPFGKEISPVEIQVHGNMFYIIDYKNVKVHVFDESFVHKKSFLIQGKGPGEISGNVFFMQVLENNQIYILDPMMARINYYKDYIFSDTINLNMMVNRFVSIDANSFVFSLLMNQQGYVLEKYNISSQKSEKVFSYKTKEKGMGVVIEGQFKMLYDNGDIYFGYLFKNKIVKYSLSQDKIIKERMLPKIKEYPIKDNPIEYIYITDMQLYKDYILVLASDPKGKKINEKGHERYLYVFNKNLDVINRVKLTVPLLSICVSKDTVFGLAPQKVIQYILIK